MGNTNSNDNNEVFCEICNKIVNLKPYSPCDTCKPIFICEFDELFTIKNNNNKV